MDMGYTHSVLQECLGYLANQRMEAQGAKGDVKVYKWTTDWTANLEQGILIHSFIVIPECPPHTLYWGRTSSTSPRQQYYPQETLLGCQ